MHRFVFLCFSFTIFISRRYFCSDYRQILKHCPGEACLKVDILSLPNPQFGTSSIVVQPVSKLSPVKMLREFVKQINGISVKNYSNQKGENFQPNSQIRQIFGYLKMANKGIPKKSITNVAQRF